MTPQEKLDEGIAAQQQEEMTYADDWTDESIFWAMNGIYRNAANTLPSLARGAIHIDLACGVGYLPMFIARRNALATVLGVERNPHMLRHTLSLHQELQGQEGVPIPLQIHHSEVMGIGEDGIVRSFYLPTAELQSHARTKASPWLPNDLTSSKAIRIARLEQLGKYPTPDPDLSRPGVKIVIDDITKLELTRHLLGDKEVQSFSSSFAGSSARILRAEGVRTGDYASAQKVFEEKGAEKEAREIDFIAERLAPKGSLLLVSRMPADLTATREQQMRAGQSFQDYLGKHIDLFEPNFSVGFTRGSFQNPTNGRIDWLALNGKTRLREARVATALFRRK